jgi:hypothetical protein
MVYLWVHLSGRGVPVFAEFSPEIRATAAAVSLR